MLNYVITDECIGDFYSVTETSVSFSVGYFGAISTSLLTETDGSVIDSV